MTIHEAKLIQTFPPDYTICGSWGEAMRQIGNAVPVKLAELVGTQIRIALEGRSCKSYDGVVYPVSRGRTEQLRLAIEGVRGLKGSARRTANVAVKRSTARRPKSVKARYAAR